MAVQLIFDNWKSSLIFNLPMQDYIQDTEKSLVLKKSIDKCYIVKAKQDVEPLVVDMDEFELGVSELTVRRSKVNNLDYLFMELTSSLNKSITWLSSPAYKEFILEGENDDEIPSDSIIYDSSEDKRSSLKPAKLWFTFKGEAIEYKILVKDKNFFESIVKTLGEPFPSESEYEKAIDPSEFNEMPTNIINYESSEAKLRSAKSTGDLASSMVSNSKGVSGWVAERVAYFNELASRNNMASSFEKKSFKKTKELTTKRQTKLNKPGNVHQKLHEQKIILSSSQLESSRDADVIDSSDEWKEGHSREFIDSVYQELSRYPKLIEEPIAFSKYMETRVWTNSSYEQRPPLYYFDNSPAKIKELWHSLPYVVQQIITESKDSHCPVT